MAGYIIKNGTIYVPETGKFEKKTSISKMES